MMQPRYKHDPEPEEEQKSQQSSTTVSTANTSQKPQVKIEQKKPTRPNPKAQTQNQKENKKPQTASTNTRSKSNTNPQKARGNSKQGQGSKTQQHFRQNKLTSKFKALMEHNKKEYNFDEVKALYRIQRKQIENKPPVVKFSEVKAFITRPVKPLVKSFYEKHIADKSIINNGLEQGKLVKGRLCFDIQNKDKQIGFVKVPNIEQPIKIWGLRNLNRAFHLDEVAVKLIQWIEWGKASSKQTQNIDFDEYLSYLGKEERDSIERQREQQAIEDEEENRANEEQEEQEGDDQEEDNQEYGEEEEENEDEDIERDQNQDMGEWEYYGEDDNDKENQDNYYDEEGQEEGQENGDDQKDEENEDLEDSDERDEDDDENADDQKDQKDDYYDYENYGQEDQDYGEEKEVEEAKNKMKQEEAKKKKKKGKTNVKAKAKNKKKSKVQKVIVKEIENQEQDYDEEYGDLVEQSLIQLKDEYGEEYGQEEEEEDELQEEDYDLENDEDGEDEEDEEEYGEEDDIDRDEDQNEGSITKEKLAKQLEENAKLNDADEESQVVEIKKGKEQIEGSKQNPNKKGQQKQNKQKVPIFTPPVIMKPPKIESKEQLINFLSQDKIKVLRPLGKIVAITSSIKKDLEYYGLMKRIRIGKKEKNDWRQVIEPEDPSLPQLFLVSDKKIKDTQQRRVKFNIAGWRDKWILAKLIE